MLTQAAELSELTEEFVQNPAQLIGVPIALVGAVLLSIGAQLQHRGVAKVSGRGTTKSGGLGRRAILGLLGRPSWVMGTLLLGLAIVLQLTSLAFSPLTLVQPLGAVALVVTAVLNSRVARVRLNSRSRTAIGLCVGGVALFVTIAAITTGESPVTTGQIATVLIVLAVVLVLAVLAYLAVPRRMRALFYILAAGVIYGFVATLAKIIISRVQAGSFDALTALCVVGLLVATLLGAYFVQNAYSSGPPDLVIAGLTVVDPMIAVGIGIVVLGEAQGASAFAILGFLAAGAIATVGVFQLARHHPQVR